MIGSLTVPFTHELQVLAEVPSSMAVGGRVSRWSDRERDQPSPLCFLEGPVLDGQGGLYVTDLAWGRILHVDAARRVAVVLEYEGVPNGLALMDDDRLLVADAEHGLLVVEGVSSGSIRISELLGDADGAPFLGLNDLIVARDRSVYFTDQGDSGLHDRSGRVFRLDPSGQLETLLSSVPSPNGLVLDEVGNTLYVAVTRDNAVWRVPLRDGPRKVGRYLQLSGGVGPDGLAWGPKGTLLVAHLGMGVVWVYDRRGLPVLGLQAPRGLATTNVCVDEQGRVYVTEGETGTVLTADLGQLLGFLGT